MYESPITAVVNDITSELACEHDRVVLKTIQSVGISVDKDELVKALRYDRQQYDKGYSEGYADGYAVAIEELVAQRDKVLNKMCEFCGICSEKSRTPLECEVAGFVAEPPKEVE